MLRSRISPKGPPRSAAMDGAELTQRLLAFSRKQKLQPREIPINAFVGEARRFLTRVIGEDIELALALYPTEGWVFVDPHQLQNALLNLAINARDAMPAGGTLTIETARERVHVNEAAPYRRMAAGRLRRHPG